jgi:hypothetical protein
MGVKDTLDYKKAKAKKGKKPATDSVLILGSFTVDGEFNMADNVIIDIGSDSFEIPTIAFVEKNGAYRCKNYDTGNSFVTAKFDPVKCKYSIKIKKTVLSDSGDVDFGIDISDTYLQAADKITLP